MIKNRKRVVRSFLLITQLGFAVMAPIFLCIFLGWFLDSRFETRTMIWLLFIGFLAGGRNGWLMVKEILRMDEDKEEEKENDGGGENQRQGEGQLKSGSGASHRKRDL